MEASLHIILIKAYNPWFDIQESAKVINSCNSERLSPFVTFGELYGL